MYIQINIVTYEATKQSESKKFPTFNAQSRMHAQSQNESNPLVHSVFSVLNNFIQHAIIIASAWLLQAQATLAGSIENSRCWEQAVGQSHGSLSLVRL